MLIFNNKEELNKYLQRIFSANFTIGFVPTMGALHKGHLSLLEKSIENNTNTVVSIFVNPTQFNNPEDLKNYPRTFENDLEKIKTVSDEIIIYAPTVEDIYEGDTATKQYDFDGLENQMEGKFRPGHFDGVATVVKKLFKIVTPTNAYFGEKDFQQLQIIKKLVKKEKIPVTIIECPIYREANGLAMSSRNERLSAKERENASVIFETLKQAKTLFKTNSAKNVTDFVSKEFKKLPDFELEYFEIAEEETLLTCINKSENKNYRAFIAIFVNKIRLIDTISLK
ncbi:pantoate--beta-alanine ligase [Flavobacterium sp.]|uniref:pantoate--beta-alanine ligase n=1 Tax=Flavobacterium sp. TaxID=239 RepID=UPI003BB9E86D